MVKKTVWRISMVKMLYAKPSRVKKGTPEPFCEIRAFIFSKTKPTAREEMLYKKGLKAVINNTENLFISIVDAKKEDALDDPEWGDLEKQTVDTEFPKTPKVEIEIDGYEVEEIDLDEVAQWVKEDRLHFDFIYRYVAFREPDGTIGHDYDEEDCQAIERIS